MIGDIPMMTVDAGKQPAGAELGSHLQALSGKESSQRCNPTIIELFGVPGVGKTTLVRAVALSEFHVTRVKLAGAWRQLSLGRKSAFIVRALLNVRCLASAARFAFRARLTSLESMVRLVRLIAKTHWIRAQSGRLILDQSFLQEIWSICISADRAEPDQTVLAQFIRRLYCGIEAHIVFADADAAIASERITGRNYGHSRLDGLAAADVEARLAQMARLPHAIIAAATAAGLPIDRLDAGDRVEANIGRLRALLLVKSGGLSSA